VAKVAFTCRSTGDVNGKTFALGGAFACVPEIGYNHYRVVETSSYHAHKDCVELVFCLRGTCVYETPEGKFSFKAGTVFMSSPGQLHVLRIYHKNLSLYWVRFQVRHLSVPFLGLPSGESVQLVRRLANIPHRMFRGGEALKRAFRQVFRCCEGRASPKTEASLRMRLVLLELALAAVDAGESRPYDVKHGELEQVVERMRRAPGESYFVRGIAEELGLSVAGLITAFKRQTGYSPYAFLLSCRIETAKAMLRTGANVSVVASRTGFSTQKRFSVYFRQAVGCSPRQWANGTRDVK